jgi:MFS family permease
MSVITAQPAKAVSQSKIVIAAIIGNLLEFFDFTVYSFFALTIAKLFFPAHDPVVSTLLALSAFAIGFIFSCGRITPSIDDRSQDCVLRSQRIGLRAFISLTI